jgi:hypothetical protein
MDKYEKWTDTRIVKRYETLSIRVSKVVEDLVNAGLGDLKPNDMRKLTHPLCDKYLKLVDEMSDLRSEAQMRFGPGFINIKQLIWRHH